jgi:hypothetical protein
VSCSNSKKCIGEKPDDQRSCSHDAPECHACKATIFGGPKFDGWSLELQPGEYTSSTLEHLGAKCDDVSSLKVFGYYCHLTGYEYGDFNTEHNGWQTTFDFGNFSQTEMVKHGAKDNDMSSVKVYETRSENQHRSSTIVVSMTFVAALALIW